MCDKLSTVAVMLQTLIHGGYSFAWGADGSELPRGKGLLTGPK